MARWRGCTNVRDNHSCSVLAAVPRQPNWSKRVLRLYFDTKSRQNRKFDPPDAQYVPRTQQAIPPTQKKNRSLGHMGLVDISLRYFVSIVTGGYGFSKTCVQGIKPKVIPTSTPGHIRGSLVQVGAQWLRCATPRCRVLQWDRSSPHTQV